jgi:hypothetical protein
MTNDLTTLSGALLEMKDELIYQLGQKGVTATYSSSDGLLGLIEKIGDIQTSGSCYHIELNESSYTTIGTFTVSATLQSNYIPLSGATVTFSGGTSSVTATTNSNGVATATVTFSTSGTLTATYSNVNDTASVSVVTYYFLDTCQTDNTSQYGNYIRLQGDTSQCTLTYDSTNNYYVIDGTGNYFSGFEIPNTSNISNIKIRLKVKLNSTSAFNQCYIGVHDSSDITTTIGYRIRGDKKFQYFYNHCSNEATVNSSYSYNTDWYYLELVKNGSNITGTVYNSSMNQLATDTRTGVANFNNPVYTFALQTEQGIEYYIQEIKAEPI